MQALQQANVKDPVSSVLHLYMLSSSIVVSTAISKHAWQPLDDVMTVICSTETRAPRKAHRVPEHMQPALVWAHTVVAERICDGGGVCGAGQFQQALLDCIHLQTWARQPCL